MMRQRKVFWGAARHGVTGAVAALLFLGISAGPCAAHALSPVHYPLGPIPVMVIREMWWFVPVVAGMIGAEVGVLRLLVPGATLGGSLWRGLLLFVAGHVAETVVYMIPQVALLGWTSDPVYIVAGAAALVVAAGIVVRAILLKGLYRRRKVSWGRAWLVALLAGAASYAVGYVFTVVGTGCLV